MGDDLELRPNAGASWLLALFFVMFAGVCAAIAAEQAQHHRSTVAPLAIGAIGAVLAVMLYLKLRKRRLRIDANGVELQGTFSTKRIGWNEVSSYTFVSLDPQAHMHGYGQGGLAAILVFVVIKALRKKRQNRMFKAGRLTLHGERAKVSIGASFRDVDQALERIFAEVHPRLASTASFGVVAFDGRTLSHKTKGALPLMELDKVVVGANGTVAVHKLGKRLSWATLSMSKVHNSMLLFERLADAGANVQMHDTVFLPLPTRSMLQRIRDARANLPKARIHGG